MKLYPLPGGDWAGTEADWKKAMKAQGLDPKLFEATKTREVPTGKKELMEFLIFFGVDVYRLPGGATQAATPVDVEALRALHNPGAGVKPSELAAIADGGEKPFERGFEAGTQRVANSRPDLDQMFEAASISHQLQLAVNAIDRADAALLKT